MKRPVRPEITREKKSKRERFLVTMGRGSFYVYKNPTQYDYDIMFSRFKKEYPESPKDTPKTRTSYDKLGNKYVWMSGDTIHAYLEAYFKKRGIYLTQNLWEINDDSHEKLIEKINNHAWIPIRDKRIAKRLIIERIGNKVLGYEIWDNLSKDTKSKELFNRPKYLDPSRCVVFVDVDYLSKNRGNELRGDLVLSKIRGLIKKGTKLNSVPIFFLNKGELGEGNHRVQVLKELGYKSIPVMIYF